MNSIETKNINIAYGNVNIVEDLNLEIPKGKITTIIGANGCGKSTILKTIARILKAKSGDIYINSENINEQSSKEIARNMAVLPQSPQAPGGLTVEELIAYGRFPHQSGFKNNKQEDKEIVDWALKATGISEFRDRKIEDLSGGQRQRAWIAMALAQQTDILLLDEPTTYLDLAHQLEVLEVLDELNKKGVRFGITNLIEHKGKENTMFKKWSEKYIVHSISSNYISFNDNTIKKDSKEVFVTNYLINKD